MQFILPFFHKSGNRTVTPTAVSSSINIESKLKAIKFTNSGKYLCYVKLGYGPQIATISDTPILPGESVILGKNTEDNTCAFIAVAATVLNIKEGEVGESCKSQS